MSSKLTIPKTADFSYRNCKFLRNHDFPREFLSSKFLELQQKILLQTDSRLYPKIKSFNLKAFILINFRSCFKFGTRLSANKSKFSNHQKNLDKNICFDLREKLASVLRFIIQLYRQTIAVNKKY